MAKPIYILNGPNLNLLGQREPGIYGADSLDDIQNSCSLLASELGHLIEFRQSNHEGKLVDWVQEANSEACGIILNAGAYTHTSIALHDAIKAGSVPVIELHLSNIHAREAFRHKSYIAPVASGVLFGFGANGYGLAIRAMANMIGENEK
jgi:3-dehydroquinate dehydratase-2